jgi:hemerythrin
MLQWNNTYETGNRFIDSEHHLLFDIANQVAANAITSPERFKEFYLELMQYTHLHFASEEVLMKEIGYQNLLTHQQSHQTIMHEMQNLLTTARSMESIVHDLEAFMQKWLVNHIVREDMAWRPVYVAWKNARLGKAPK